MNYIQLCIVNLEPVKCYNSQVFFNEEVKCGV